MEILRNNQIQERNAWLHDIFIWAGEIPASSAKRTVYKSMYSYHDAKSYKAYAVTVNDAIIYRKFAYKDLRELDQALDYLKQFPFIPYLNTNAETPDSAYTKKKAETLAKYIASFCQEKKLYWDDSTTSTYEKEKIERNTLLGPWLVSAECLTSQHVNDKPEAPAATTTSTTTASTRQPSQRQAGQAPANGYKSSGAHSQDIPNLIGQPNSKVSINGSAYCVIADKLGKNTPSAYITPLKTTNNSIIQVSKTDAENVRFGSANGYTDCTCWFETSVDADNFCYNCMGKFNNKYTNIHVVSAKADPNGYFEVSTEFGNCFIKAKVLNEEIVENNKKSDTVMQVYADDVALYENALYREM